MCARQGDLVMQTVEPPLEMKRCEKPMPWVFRYYLCRWHRAAYNRNRLRHCKKAEVVDYVPDEILLPNKLLNDIQSP